MPRGQQGFDDRRWGAGAGAAAEAAAEAERDRQEALMLLEMMMADTAPSTSP